MDLEQIDDILKKEGINAYCSSMTKQEDKVLELVIDGLKKESDFPIVFIKLNKHDFFKSKKIYINYVVGLKDFSLFVESVSKFHHSIQLKGVTEKLFEDIIKTHIDFNNF